MHQRRHTLRFAAAAIAVVVLAAPSRAQIFVNFDDLPASNGVGVPITNPYQGATWALSGNPMGLISTGTPSYTDVVCRSGSNCAFNGFGLISGITRTTPFTFNGWLRRWNWTSNTGGATSVLIEALNGSTVVSSVTVTPTSSYQFFQLLTSMTSVRFTPQGGAGLGCAQGSANGGYFLLDDVTFNPQETPPTPGVVPEPSTYALLLTGFGALLVLRRRQQR